MYIYIYIYIYLYIHIHTHIQIYICIYTYKCIYIDRYICSSQSMHDSFQNGCNCFKNMFGSLDNECCCLQSTGWQTCIGCLKLQISFRKEATNFRVLLREMTSKNEHPVTLHHPVRLALSKAHSAGRRVFRRCKTSFTCVT